MTVKEQLEKWLCEYGLTEVEAELVVEHVWDGGIKDTEIKEFWEKDISELKNISPVESTDKEDEELVDVVLSVVWNISKTEARKLLYFKMEELAELIVKFK